MVLVVGFYGGLACKNTQGAPSSWRVNVKRGVPFGKSDNCWRAAGRGLLSGLPVRSNTPLILRISSAFSPQNTTATFESSGILDSSALSSATVIFLLWGKGFRRANVNQHARCAKNQAAHLLFQSKLGGGTEAGSGSVTSSLPPFPCRKIRLLGFGLTFSYIVSSAFFGPALQLIFQDCTHP